MIPSNSSSVGVLSAQGKYPSRTWYVDPKRKRVIRMTDGLEAIEQAVRKRLTTERYASSIYSSSYGVEFNQLIGKPMPYVEAVIQQLLEEALFQDDRIKSVQLLNLKRGSADGLQISMLCSTVAGDLMIGGEFGSLDDLASLASQAPEEEPEEPVDYWVLGVGQLGLTTRLA